MVWAWSHARVFMQLVAKGGALHGKDADGKTPLALVAEHGSPEFKQQLNTWVRAETARREKREL